MKVELLFITPDSERLIETAGRISYLSYDRQREDSEKKFVRMIVKSGHHSVLEHANATFRISGVSRAFTHQLVRHRLCSFTQQSQRYVNESNFEYIEPESIRENPEAHSIFASFMDETKKVYSELRKLQINKEDARFVLPNAAESQIIVTANFREWRHIIELRGSLGAQWEIREVAIEILKVLRSHAPEVFEDYEIDNERKAIRKRKTNDTLADN